VTTRRVTFLPDDKSVEVGEDTSLLDAAHQAGVYVNSLCGGDGICGRCRLVLREGDIQEKRHPLLTRDEVRRNYILACTSFPRSDVVVEVPVESRLEGGRIVKDLDAERFSGLRREQLAEARYAHAPLVEKILLDLPTPSIDDPLADLQRLYQAIRNRREAPIMQMGLAQTRRIAKVLRESTWGVTALLGQRGGTLEVVSVEPGDTSPRNYALAVDIGTTTIVAHLVDLCSGETRAAEAAYNPQIKYGEDVISRIAFAEKGNGLDVLHESVVEAINDLVTLLTRDHDVRRRDVTAVIVACNTTMGHLLFKLDPANIRREPYVPVAVHMPPVRAVEVGIRINPRGLLYTLPAVSAYVGSDVTGDVLTSGMTRADELAMLIDVGTNGEVVIGNKEWLVCASASAGPAFEGGEVRHGMRATHGAIERVIINKNNKEVAFSTIGDEAPRGVCGSGILDLIAELLRTGIIDRAGKLVINGDSCRRCRATETGPEFVIAFEEENALDEDIVITQPDITNVIRSKAAIFAAARVLVRKVGLEVNQIQRIYVAGGFGNYLDARRAIDIGLLPDVPVEKIRYIGNGSVQGANLVIRSVEAAHEAERIARTMTYVDLSTDNMFMDEYVQASFLPHTDVRLFPSVQESIVGRTDPISSGSLLRAERY